MNSSKGCPDRPVLKHEDRYGVQQGGIASRTCIGYGQGMFENVTVSGGLRVRSRRSRDRDARLSSGASWPTTA